MDDLTRRIQQQNALNYQRIQKQKKETTPPPLLRIGEYHPETGRYKVLFPDGGQVIGGVKLFDGGIPAGTPIRSTRAYGSQAIGLDRKNYQPIPIQEEETIASTPETQELPPPATTCVTLAGISLDEQGFAETLIQSDGYFETYPFSLEEVLTDRSLSSYAFSFTSGAFVELGFSKSVSTNIALFELGIEDRIRVTINNIVKTYTTTSTGYTIPDEFAAGGFYSVNVAIVDLSDFGVNSTERIKIRLDIRSPEEGTVPSLCLVAALCPL